MHTAGNSNWHSGMKTIVIGLGNPILGDDGIGWRVAEQVEKRLLEGNHASVTSSETNGRRASDSIEFECLSLGGLSLMEFMIGYDRAILIDAIKTGKAPLGTVSHFPITELPNRAIGHFSSAHDTTLQNAIEVGRSMGAQLPQEIIVVAVEAQFIYDFSEQLSAPIAASLPEAVETVMELLK
jgi:hydrogenase maturation protease